MAALFAVLIGGCQAASLSLNQADMFDGLYVAPSRPVAGSPETCSAGVVKPFIVNGGLVQYRLNNTVRFSTPVNADGAFSQLSNNVTLQGKITGDDLSAQTYIVSQQRCRYEYSGIKSAVPASGRFNAQRSYRGTLKPLTSGLSSLEAEGRTKPCPNSIDLNFIVRRGYILSVWNDATLLAAELQEDGSFKGVLSPINFFGKVTAAAVSATLSGNGCTYSVEAARL